MHVSSTEHFPNVILILLQICLTNKHKLNGHSFTERDDRSMSGRDRNRSIDMGPDKTDSDWRARPSADADEGPRRDDAYGESERFHFSYNK